MDYKRPGLEDEFLQVHPSVRAIVVELDRWLVARHMPGVTITHALRTEAHMASIYGADWKGRKWSWHLVGRAVDIRNRDWSPMQRTQIVKFLQKNWPDAEVIMHDIGRGDHLHFGYPPPGNRIKRLKRWQIRRRAKDKTS